LQEKRDRYEQLQTTGEHLGADLGDEVIPRNALGEEDGLES
jgi:hypothetical protein